MWCASIESAYLCMRHNADHQPEYVLFLAQAHQVHLPAVDTGARREVDVRLRRLPADGARGNPSGVRTQLHVGARAFPAEAAFDIFHLGTFPRAALRWRLPAFLVLPSSPRRTSPVAHSLLHTRPLLAVWQIEGVSCMQVVGVCDALQRRSSTTHVHVWLPVSSPHSELVALPR